MDSERKHVNYIKIESSVSKETAIFNKAFLHQLCLSLFASLGYFMTGLSRAWASPAIPSLQGFNNNTEYMITSEPLSLEVVSWIASTLPLGAMTGGFFSSVLLQLLGRKYTLLIASVLNFGGFLLIGASFYIARIETIILARGLTGLAAGFSIPSAPIYITESVDSSVRGLYGSFPAVAMALGILVCYITGAFLPWHYLSFFCAGFAMLMLCSLVALPQSPFWLLSKGKTTQALQALQWYRGSKNVEKEYNSMVESHEAQNNNNNNNNNKGYNDKTTGSSSSLWKQIQRREIWKPLLISMAIMFFQQWCGVNAIIFNVATIFNQAGSSINSHLSAVIIGIVQFIATLGSIFVIETAGRRPLLMISGITMCVTTCILGTFFYFKTHEGIIGMDWIVLVSLIIYMIGYSIGFASIPFLLMGEIFPGELRSVCSGFSSFFNLLNTFLVTKLFSNLIASIGYAWLFWIYSIISLAGLFFVVLWLPETKGKNSEDIKQYFMGLTSSKV